jgi:hypothetical protein
MRSVPARWHLLLQHHTYMIYTSSLPDQRTPDSPHLTPITTRHPHTHARMTSDTSHTPQSDLHTQTSHTDLDISHR